MLRRKRSEAVLKSTEGIIDGFSRVFTDVTVILFVLSASLDYCSLFECM